MLSRRDALLVGGLLSGALAAFAKPKRVTNGPSSMGNDYIDIQATPLLTREQIQEALGADPGPGIIVVQVHIEPKLGKKISVSPDDFVLLSHKDGSRSGPYEPAQIAGNGGLVITSEGRAERGFGGSGVGFGGLGMGSGGPSTGGPRPTGVKTEKSTGKENPLLTTLKMKALPNGETEQPVSGYLYFPLDGKQKAKDLMLMYKGPAGRLSLDFHQ